MFFRINRADRGQTTIFLSLILIMIVSLIFTLLESARSEGLSLRLQLAADAAVASAFAAWQKEIWEDYGLLLFSDSEGDAGEMRGMITQYAAKNAYEEEPLGRDWLALNAPRVTELKYMLITDDHGEVFMKAANTYMKECGLITEIMDLSESWDDAMDGVDATALLNSDGELDFGGIGKLIEKANDQIQSASGAEEDDTEEPEDPPETEMSPAEAMEIFVTLTNRFAAWKSRGLLMLVCDNVSEISEETIDKDPLPSSEGDDVKDRRAGEPMSHGVIDNMIFREYLMQTFNSYRDDHKDTLELEYLIAGKDSDLANLSSVAKRMLGIRTGLNYIFLKSHSDYKAELMLIATAISAWLGNEKLIDLVKEVLAVIWALAEAIGDVRALMTGGKIPLIKSDGEWRLTLRNAAAGAVSDEGGGDGMKYEEYLRLLLYLKWSDTLAYRAMDCIQLRMIKKNKDFLMKNCIYAARVKLEAEAGSLFPFLPEKLGYLVTAESGYSYGAVSY